MIKKPDKGEHRQEEQLEIKFFSRRPWLKSPVARGRFARIYAFDAL
jgi:hypothetical protein